MAQDYQISGTLSLEDQMSNVLKNAMDSVSQFGSKTQNAMRNASASVESISKAMKIGGAAVTAMGVKSLKSFGDFQASLNKAAIVAGGTSKNIGELADVANRMGAELPLSAQDAADAMVAMAQDGASIDKIKEEFPAIAKAATAAGSDLQATASIVQQSMNIWGDSLKSPSKSAAILVETANMSNASVEDMQQVMADVGSTAKQMGMNMQDTATAVGLLTNKGIPAAQAAQNLNFALTRMIKPSKSAQNVLDELGMSYFTANGKMKPFSSILTELGMRTQNLNEHEKNLALTTLFGQSGFKVMTNLMDNLNDTTGDTTTSWDAFSKKIYEVSASSEAANAALNEQATDMQQNIGSKIEQVGGNWEALRNTAMQSTSDINSSIVDMANQFLTAAGNSDTAFGRMAQNFVGFSTIIGPSIVAVGQFTGSMNALFTGTSNLKTAFTALLSPQMLIAAGIAGLVAIFITAYTKSEALRQAVSNIGEAFSSVFSPAVEGAKGSIGGIIGAVGNLAAEIGNNLAQTLNSINWNAAFGSVNGIIDGVIQTVANLIQALVNTGAVTAIWDFLRSVIDLIATAIGNVVNGITTFISSSQGASDTSQIFTIIGDAIKNIFVFLTNVVNGIIQFINVMNQTGAVTAVWELIKVTIGTIVQVIGAVIGAIGNFIGATQGIGSVNGIFEIIGVTIKVIATLLTGLIEIVGTVVTFMIEQFGNFAAWFMSLWGPIIEGVKVVWQGFSDFMAPIVAAIQNLWGSLAGFFSELWNQISSFTVDAWNNIKGVVIPIMQIIQVAITAALGIIKAIWNGTWSVIGTIVSTIWNVIKTVISTTINVIAGIIKTVTDLIKGNWSGVWNDIKGIISTVWNGIKSVITTVFGGVKNVIVSVLNTIKSIWNSIWNGVFGVIKSIWNGIKSTVKNNINAIKGLMNIGSALFKLGKDAITGFWNGLKSMFGWIGKKVQEFVDGIVKGFKKVLSIHSPSKVLREIGSYTGQGFALGLDDEYKNVSNIANNLANAAIPDIKSNTISDVVNTANRQLSTGLNANVNGNMVLTQQPAYINLQMGNNAYNGFVDDITKEQNVNLDITSRYRLGGK